MKVQDNSKGWPEGWLVAAAAAVWSAAMARVVGDLGLFAVVMIALFVFLVFGVLLGLFWGLPATPSDPRNGHGSLHGTDHGTAHAHGHGAGHAAPHGSAASAPAATVAAHAETVSSGDRSATSGLHAMDMATEAADTLTLPASTPVFEPAMAAAAPTEAMAEPAPVDTPVTAVVEAPVAAPPAAEPGLAAASMLAGIAESPDTALADPEYAEGDTDDAAPGVPRRTREERQAARAAKAARQAARTDRSADAVPESPAVAEVAAVAPAPADPVGQPDAAPGAAASPGAAQKPQGLAAARGGVPDRLQTIEGIGPALEKLCHDMGVYHFDQIASWGAAEVAWMDSNLKGFRGRVTRDRWVRQAALIGEVGIDEFLRRAKTNDY